jgi:hypothetical protein
MKKQIAVAIALLAAVIVASPCYAQRDGLKGNVPFAFQVGNKTMPAGDYTIDRLSLPAGSILIIRRCAGDDGAMVSTFIVDAKNGESQPELVFHKYGDTYFLSEVWTGDARGRKLYRSDREKELQRDSGKELAVTIHFVPQQGL